MYTTTSYNQELMDQRHSRTGAKRKTKSVTTGGVWRFELMDGTPTLALLLLCHFERFRSAVVSSEPAAAQILEMSEMPDAVEPGRSVFGYCPFDLRHAGGPEPRRGLPNEPVRGTKKNKHTPNASEQSKETNGNTAVCSSSLRGALYSLGFPVGIGRHHVPFQIVREMFDRQKRHLQHRVVPRVAGHLHTTDKRDIIN